MHMRTPRRTLTHIRRYAFACPRISRGMRMRIYRVLMRMRESGTRGLCLCMCLYMLRMWNGTLRACLLHVTRSVCASICKCVLCAHELVVCRARHERMHRHVPALLQSHLHLHSHSLLHLHLHLHAPGGIHMHVCMRLLMCTCLLHIARMAAGLHGCMAAGLRGCVPAAACGRIHGLACACTRALVPSYTRALAHT